MVTWPLLARGAGLGEIEYQENGSKNHCVWSSYSNRDWFGLIATPYNLGAPLAEKGGSEAYNSNRRSSQTEIPVQPSLSETASLASLGLGMFINSITFV